MARYFAFGVAGTMASALDSLLSSNAFKSGSRISTLASFLSFSRNAGALNLDSPGVENIAYCHRLLSRLNPGDFGINTRLNGSTFAGFLSSNLMM